jgi:hypothetical protein
MPVRLPRRTDVYLTLRSSVLDGLSAPGERLPSSPKAVHS